MTSTTQRCGGHITLLFTVDKSNALMRSQGSKGAGFSIHHGVEATGQMRRRPPSTEPRMSGIVPDPRTGTSHPSPSEVSVCDINGEHIENVDIYLDFIQACHDATLLRDDESIRLDVTLECPRSQGFGMSAAGLIATGTSCGLSEHDKLYWKYRPCNILVHLGFYEDEDFLARREDDEAG